MYIDPRCLLFLLICNVSIVISDKNEWWKYTTIYEVLIPSFKDSDGDGIGDIKGKYSMTYSI